MNIAVIGSGYVGTTTAAILANAGHTVTALDIDKERVSKINAGEAPFFEAGLGNLIAKAVSNKTLTATSKYSEAIPSAEVIFSCVGTPDNPDGSPNLDYIYAAAAEAATLMKKDAIYVQKSTVPVGTGKEVIREIEERAPEGFSYISNPEFLREGTAIKDTLIFDRIVLGGDSQKAKSAVASLYEDVENNKRIINDISEINIESDLLNEHTGSYVFTTLQSAELIKVTANAFLALKISFANSMAKLADHADADVVEVMDGVGADKRIGRAFLNAGRGYGGGCFPKDVSGLISSAGGYGVDLRIMTAATEVNSSMPGYIANKLKTSIGSLAGKRCAVLGLAFKPGTSDARKSPAVALANALVKEGATVTAYDPEAMQEAKEDLKSSVKLKESALQAAKGADIVLVATDWQEFTELDLKQLHKTTDNGAFVDCMNAFTKSSVEEAGFTYIGVGR